MKKYCTLVQILSIVEHQGINWRSSLYISYDSCNFRLKNSVLSPLSKKQHCITVVAW